eukprot:640712-Prymnesium_polylepis.1
MGRIDDIVPRTVPFPPLIICCRIHRWPPVTSKACTVSRLFLMASAEESTLSVMRQSGTMPTVRRLDPLNDPSLNDPDISSISCCVTCRFSAKRRSSTDSRTTVRLPPSGLGSFSSLSRLDCFSSFSSTLDRFASTR